MIKLEQRLKGGKEKDNFPYLNASRKPRNVGLVGPRLTNVGLVGLLAARKTEWQRDGRAPLHMKIGTTIWKTKGAQNIISVEINGKLRRKKRAHILNQARAHTFLTV